MDSFNFLDERDKSYRASEKTLGDISVGLDHLDKADDSFMTRFR